MGNLLFCERLNLGELEQAMHLANQDLSGRPGLACGWCATQRCCLDLHLNRATRPVLGYQGLEANDDKIIKLESVARHV